jgi:hypothetical protein
MTNDILLLIVVGVVTLAVVVDVAALIAWAMAMMADERD